MPAPNLRTMFRSLPRAQALDHRDSIATARRAHPARTTGTGAQVLYDVTTLHVENQDEDTVVVADAGRLSAATRNLRRARIWVRRPHR